MSMVTKPRSPLAERFNEERLRLGLSVQATADVCGITRCAVGNIFRGSMPGGGILQKFSLAGADIQFILTGTRNNSTESLALLFGKTLPMQEPLHLLGASLYLLNANAVYQDELNPYPPTSPHHAGVATGWRMAQAAMSGVAAPLPGTL